MKEPPWKLTPEQTASEESETIKYPNGIVKSAKTGQFVGGTGRPKGSRNKITIACEELLEGEGEKLTRKAIDLALKGDTTALKLCLDRIIPVRKGRPLPALNKQTDETSVEALLRSVLSGEISPEEGKEVIGLVEGAARVAATQLLTEMRQRQLDALQKAGASGGVVMVPMLDPSKLSTQALEEVLSVITY